MALARVLSSTLLASGLTLLPTPAAAQGTASDYARSEGLRARIDSLVIDAAEAPIWIGAPSNQFIYRKSVQGGSAFMLVDAATLEKRPAFDHDRLAASIAVARRSWSNAGRFSSVAASTSMNVLPPRTDLR